MPGRAIVTIRDKQWQVSVAGTPWELAQGLGGLPDLAPGTGMLFDTGWEQVVQVTTVPMLFPLDIAFFSESLLVTEAYRNVEPGFIVTSTVPTRYFLEVNAGELEGIEAGDSALVELLSIAETPPVASDWTSTMVSFFGFVVMGAFMVAIVKGLVKDTLEPEKKPVLYGPRGEKLLPQIRSAARYEIETDRMGNIIVTRTDDPGKDVFLQFEADKDLVYNLLEKGEKKDLDAGWSVTIRRSEPRASTLDELWESSAQPQKLPQTRKHKPNRSDVSVDSWQERDRLGIWITDRRTDKVIAEWWDEDAREMFEQGWFKPGDIRQQKITGRAFEESVLDYAESVGLVAGSGKYLPQTVRSGYYWTAVNKNTGEIVESQVPYRNSGRALRGGKAWASRHWQNDRALIEVWKQPYRYSENLEIAPVASELVTLGQPAVLPTEPRPRRPKPDELEFLPDSPEFLAYTIEDIGYRDKLDNAFHQAIRRAKGPRRSGS